METIAHKHISDSFSNIITDNNFGYVNKNYILYLPSNTLGNAICGSIILGYAIA